MSGKKTIITTALPYVNNTPHLGNLVGSLLSADVYARYRKRVAQQGEEVLFVGGVDEYGTATEVKAREMGVSCKELCDSNGRLHKEVYDWFLINFDCYGQTSQPNGNPAVVQHDWPQTRITHEIFQNMCKNGYVVEQTEKVMYCPAIKSFVADRFVIGTCPKCKYEKANGDQCDTCGTLFDAGDLLNPKYKPNPEFDLEVRETTNLYIDTDRIWKDKKMTEWFESRTNWTKTASGITGEWLKMGLQPRSITRDLVWGTAVPDTPEFGDRFSKKVFYVWFDAPIGYISITEKSLGRERSEAFWRDPNTKLIQFMAKDNVPFHSLIFPVTLRGSGYSEMTDVDIASTEYLLYEGKKFSKTQNVGLFCDDAMNISKKLGIPPDYWRAYLISIRPENADSNFVLNAEGGLVDFVNNILLKNFGNLVHRVLSVGYQIGVKHGVISFKSGVRVDEKKESLYFKDCDELITEYNQNMNSYKLCDALRTALKYSTEINRSFTAFAPWTLTAKDDQKDKLYEFMGLVYKHIDTLLDLLNPFMPSLTEQFKSQLVFTEVKSDEGTNSTVEIFPLTEKPIVLIKPLEKIEVDSR
ncbi:methionyl-tRNA synthetase [Yasminevirus sp. GU-2018]|uniref:methionine--tRNA ligase n=1 Tax=Yasminevirus sp. GU-2018 TaxID=2420051 RepID=A0A5K0U8D7_9VIRU|nr:methionyl-tRNA synthetase [Yasminevirus sp. GU-2018]